MHLSQFLDQYVSKWVQAEYDCKGTGRFEYSTSVKPAQYLKYAEEDLTSALTHRYINSLSNSKRAMDCQLDNIFRAFSIKIPRTFPQKLEVIGDLGLLAPRIVRKVGIS